MKIILLGGGGFIGTNLVKTLIKDSSNEITIVDSKNNSKALSETELKRIRFVEKKLDMSTDFDELLENQSIVYHLFSTTVPTTANIQISNELSENVVLSARLFDSCAKCKVKKIVFLSSGGTVYGKDSMCPLSEETPTNPITSYGIQKLSIEKLLYLYSYMYDIDYRIIRLSNPYGPYQEPNGILGAVTTFTYKALRGEKIEIYGDGSTIRDYIYIDDAIRGIMKIVNGESRYKLFNLGCGYGTSINQLIDLIHRSTGKKMNITYKESRTVDVPTNYLDIRRYEMVYGDLSPIKLEEGIKRLIGFMKENYEIIDDKKEE